MIASLGQDLRYALRQLRKNPGFAVVAVLTLALGSGATTVIFTVVSGVLLKPLAYTHPESLVTLHVQAAKRGLAGTDGQHEARSGRSIGCADRYRSDA